MNTKTKERMDDLIDLLNLPIDEILCTYQVSYMLTHHLLVATFDKIDLDSFLRGTTLDPDTANQLGLEVVTDVLRKYENSLDDTASKRLSDELVAVIARVLVDGVPDRPPETDSRIAGRVLSYIFRIDKLLEMARRDLEVIRDRSRNMGEEGEA